MKRSLKFVAVLAIISMVMMMGLPALAKGGKGKGKGQGQGRGGKKAIGTVVAYEPASNLLTATMKDGSTFSGTVAEDVKVKLDHRGNNGENKRKKPSNGDETDILPEAQILKMKVKCDEVTKLRLRANTGVPVEEPAEEVVVEEPAEDDTTHEDPATGDAPADDTTGEDGGLVDDLTDPLVRVATEDEGTEPVEEEEADDCAEEAEDETDGDDSDDLDDDLADETDGADDSADDADDSADGSDGGLDETVECIVTELEDCV